MCGRGSCDCEASHPPQESSTTGPVTPEQRTIGIAQVTPDRADDARRTEQLRFSIGPAAVDAAGDGGEETRLPVDLGLLRQMGPATAGDETRVESDEIRELKALVDELQTQVQCAGRLAALAAGWTVASPGATVQEIQRRNTPCRGAGWLKARRARDRANRLAARQQEEQKQNDANAAEAAAGMRGRAAELAAVLRKGQKKTNEIKGVTTTITRQKTTTTTKDTPAQHAEEGGNGRKTSVFTAGQREGEQHNRKI